MQDNTLYFTDMIYWQQNFLAKSFEVDELLQLLNTAILLNRLFVVLKENISTVSLFCFWRFLSHTIAWMEIHNTKDKIIVHNLMCLDLCHTCNQLIVFFSRAGTEFDATRELLRFPNQRTSSASTANQGCAIGSHHRINETCWIFTQRVWRVERICNVEQQFIQARSQNNWYPWVGQEHLPRSICGASQ